MNGRDVYIIHRSSIRRIIFVIIHTAHVMYIWTNKDENKPKIDTKNEREREKKNRCKPVYAHMTCI